MKKESIYNAIIILCCFSVWFLNFCQQWTTLRKSIEKTEESLRLSKKNLVDVYEMTAAR